jgi:hypothetical protein
MNGSTNTLEEVCQRKGILGLSAFEEYSRKLNLKSFFVAAIIMYFFRTPFLTALSYVNL